ncbi:DUF1275 domain-containing protein [Tetragenococcus halophilus]|uniref:DUF1275 domain-containing protein n=1 Tax=Tetragenococcus halophilus TaxID=51669 RepID=A0A3G5FK06_TETHA|nr:YoaK family protein [Tetragenococcus halophilus]AYW50660.1 DUF1275 domain-containing protein [Tetragenococcus halophilus]MCF1686242.1 DUF1275 domain-containing protein [Tetragenococcus halophilus]GBD63984.1 putative uncharacterized protein [Tetragenococcus halophilus subsp. flandriensis]
MKSIFSNLKRLDVYIHYIIALCGGFFGMYAITSRMGNFGQAQTANLIEVVRNILGKNMSEGVFRIVAALLFMSGIISATIMERKTKIDLRYFSISFDLIAAILIGFFPLSMNPVVALYPVFFATAFQWCIFKGAKGYPSATVFCTNNLKQATISIIDYFLLSQGNPERREKIEKAKLYGGTCVNFYLGVLISYLLWRFYGVHSIWFITLPLLINFVLVVLDSKRHAFYLNVEKNAVHENLSYDTTKL